MLDRRRSRFAKRGVSIQSCRMRLEHAQHRQEFAYPTNHGSNFRAKQQCRHALRSFHSPRPPPHGAVPPASPPQTPTFAAVRRCRGGESCSPTSKLGYTNATTSEYESKLNNPSSTHRTGLLADHRSRHARVAGPLGMKPDAEENWGAYARCVAM
jgi:hypothetical protein